MRSPAPALTPDALCSQPYTIFAPPPHVTGQATQLSILVKREPQGEVSRYLHSQRRFQWIDLRGPHPTLTEDARSPALVELDAREPEIAAKRKGWSLEGWDRVIMVRPLPPLTTRRVLAHLLAVT